MARKELTADRLREVLDFDAETGIFRWLVALSPRRKVGRPAGCLHKQTMYLLIQVDGRQYKAHRLAWLYVHGRWPRGVIDHANGVTTDNRIVNLREASWSQSNANRRPQKRIGDGLKGTCFRHGYWHARIMIHGKRLHLGRFGTSDEAHAAYVAAAKAHFGEFARAA